MGREREEWELGGISRGKAKQKAELLNIEIGSFAMSCGRMDGG